LVELEKTMSALRTQAPGLPGQRWLWVAGIAGMMLTAQALANTAPKAVAGGPYVVLPGSITFDGSASFDPDTALGDSIVGYSWAFLSSNNVIATGARPQVSTYVLYDLAAQVAHGSPIANPFTGLPTWALYLTVTDTEGLKNTALTSLRFLDGNYQVPSVPEPESRALIGLGLGVLAWAQRRRPAR
jgi:PEP-CTERM motif